MTNPFGNIAPQPVAQPQFAQPASPFGQAPAAPAMPQGFGQAGIDPLAGLGGVPTRPKTLNINASALMGHLCLFVPTKYEQNVPGKKPEDKPKDVITADVLVVRMANDQQGQVQLTYFDRDTATQVTLSHYLNPETGEPDPARPFMHNPAAGQFLAFDGVKLYNGAITDRLAICLDPKRPDLTMIAARIVSQPGKNGGRAYYALQDATDQEWPIVRQYVGAWLAQRSQFS